ncbi:MAG: AMP-binding protein [Pseudomonadales bacterium]|nr:AMP-binding protein [Pseudomonadales bacterium]
MTEDAEHAPTPARDWEPFLRSNLTLRQYHYYTAQRVTPAIPVQRLLHSITIPGHLGAFFDTAWQRVALAADALRTVLRVDDGIPRIDFESAFVPLIHTTLEAGDGLGERVEAWARQGFLRFDPGDILYRSALVHVSDGSLIWLLTCSHMVGDGRSFDLILENLRRILFGMASGEPLPPLRFASLQADMSRERQRDLDWLARHGSGDPWVEHLAGWRGPFSLFGVPVPHDIGTKQRRVTMFSLALTRHLFAQARSAHWFHRSPEITVANLFIALTAVWVWRHGGPSRMVIGVPFHGRRPQDADLIAFKSGVLPVRVAIAPGQPFADLVAAVHAEMRVCRQVDAPSVGNSFHDPVYQVACNFMYQDESAVPQDRTFARFEVPPPLGDPECVSTQQTSRPDLPGAMRITMVLREDVIRHLDLQTLSDGFRAGLEQVLDDAELPVRHIRFSEANEVRRLLARGTPATSRVAVDWLSNWVNALPQWRDRAALIHEDDVVTHGWLHAAAGQWARLLTNLPTHRGDRVIVWAPADATYAAAWIAMAGTGLVHVPVHHDMPTHHVLTIADAVDATLVLCAADRQARFAGTRLQAVPLCMHAVAQLLPLPMVDPQPWETTHIFHTSGSTGQPKAIAVTHGALAASLRSWIQANALQPGERLFHFYATTFDPWLTGLLAVLMLGGVCVSTRHGIPPTAEALQSLLRRHAVHTLCTPTAYFHALYDMPLPHGVRRWIVGGESLAADKAMRFIAAHPETALINAYGPTETTIWASILAVAPAHANAVPIGGPLPTCGFRVCDERGDTVPCGVPGELWITGAQLAIGYYGDPELTARQFVNRDGQRWYRTGDLVRWRLDGDLDFMGRLDRQVQIRGHRVEPAEIEQVLRQQPGIRDALVIPIRDDATTSLCAYLLGDDGAALPSATVLRGALLEQLADFKVPRFMLLLDAFPYGSNGKVDVARLPRPEPGDRQSTQDTLPTLTHWDVRLLFEQILGLPRIGVEENFFELGGDSLSLIELLAAVERRFGRNLDATQVMQRPTIGGLAPLLNGAGSGAAGLVVTLKRGVREPLFCIPGAGGIGVEFYPLSRRLPDDRPVVVLRSSGTDGNSAPPTSAKQLVDEHVAHILRYRTEHPTTAPVYLAGYSLGGIFAWEVAQRLSAQGIPIGHVILIDAHIATAAGRALTRRPARGLRTRFREWAFGTPQTIEMRQLAAQFTHAFRSGTPMAAASLGRYNLLAQTALFGEIVSTPATFPATYFLAASGDRHQYAKAWQALAPKLVVHTIDGDHQGDAAIVREPNVARMAMLISELLAGC